MIFALCLEFQRSTFIVYDFSPRMANVRAARLATECYGVEKKFFLLSTYRVFNPPKFVYRTFLGVEQCVH